MFDIQQKQISILTSALLILLVVKLLLENIFYFLPLSNFIQTLFNVVIISATFLIALFLVKFTNIDLHLLNRVFKKIDINVSEQSKKFLIYIKVLKYLFLIGSVFIILTPTYFNDLYIGENFLAKVYVSILAPIIIIPILYAIYVIYDKSLKSGNRAFFTKFSVLSGSILILQFIKIFDASFISLNSYILSFFDSIVYIIVFVLSIFLLNYNHWIAYLSKQVKWSLIIDMFIILICALIYAGNSDINVSWESNSITYAFEHYLYGTSTTVSLVSMAIAIISIRYIITAIVYLPSSEAFERRQTEMSSLTTLNKIIAESKDIKHITKTVTETALNMTKSIFAWSEIYVDDRIEISSQHNIPNDYMNQILEDEYFTNYRKASKSLILLDGFKKNQFITSIPFAKSLIYIPIEDSERKIGGICLINNKTYNFDEDELDIIRAYSTNLSIAFENARLLKESIENEKYKNELQIAKNIQQKLLPSEIIKLDGFTTSALSIPADDVGGDYYDSVLLANGDICYLIGDVSGKGIGAAIFMAQIKGMVMSLSPNANSGKELLCRINKALYKNIDKNMFVTISAITISNKTKKLSYCRAGHTPLAIKLSQEEINFSKPNGFGIGFVSDFIFSSNLEEIEYDLNEVELVFAFSDGLNELRNKDNNEFGYENIKFILNNYNYNNSKEINEIFLEKANAYSKNLSQFDDLTLLAILKNKE